MEVKDGHIDVQPYDYKDRDILVTADAKTILDMMSGKLDIVNACSMIFRDGQRC